MPQELTTYPAGEFACVLIDDLENPFWYPKFTIHGAGSAINPYMVCSNDLDCSPCARTRKRLLSQGSQQGSLV